LSKASFNTAGLNEASLNERVLGYFDDAGAASSREEFDPWRWALGWWKRFRRLNQRRQRRLRLCESLPLGERRFVAVVQFERSRFLVGGTPGSLVLLARLENAQANSTNNEDSDDDEAEKENDKKQDGIAPPDRLATGISGKAQP
jgi:flagellar biogenesis protein FliO